MQRKASGGDHPWFCTADVSRCPKWNISAVVIDKIAVVLHGQIVVAVTAAAPAASGDAASLTSLLETLFQRDPLDLVVCFAMIL